jgi:hypothetical protein
MAIPPFASPGVFYVTDPWLFDPGSGTYVGMLPGNPNPAIAAQNTAVLNQIIFLAQTLTCSDTTPYGALIVFPGHLFPVDQASTDGEDSGLYKGAEYFIANSPSEDYAVLITCDTPLHFLGTGNAKLTMIDDAVGDIFQINAPGSSLGGFTFENLTFSYPNVDESVSIPQWCAIHTTNTHGAQNCRILRQVGGRVGNNSRWRNRTERLVAGRGPQGA